MKYKVIKSFGCAKVGDELVESTSENGVFTMEVSEEGCYRSMTLDNITADIYCKQEYLELVEDRTDLDRVNDTVNLIDTLIEQYSSDLINTAKKAEEGSIKPCVKVETDTVLFNMIKVLTKVKEELLRDE